MPGPLFVVLSLTYISDLNALSNAILTMRTQGVNYTAQRGFWDILTANALTVTLPLAPAAGDLIRWSAKTSSITAATFGRNGQNIDGIAADLTISGGSDKDLNIWMIFVDSSTGWRPIRNTVAGWLAFGGAQATGFTAVRNTAYALTASTFTVTLPSSPVAGDQVKLTTADHTVTAITLGRNGSNINSVASDVTINAKGWEVLATFVNSTVGWLLVFDSTINPQPRYDSTLQELRYHNSQRELSDSVGWAPWAFIIGMNGTDTLSNGPGGAVPSTLAVSGGSIAVPIHVASQMLLQSLTVFQGDSSGLHTAEWRLYKQRLNNGNVGENALDEVPGANGTFSFTPGAAGLFSSNATSAPVYLPPGIYWAVVRNTSASVIFDIRYLLSSVNMVVTNMTQGKTLGSALGATLDFVAATWTKGTELPGIRLDGRVFGQTTAF